MSEAKKYPELRKKLTLGWWLSNRHYTAYMVRELTSLFITIFSLLYIYQLAVLATNPPAYSEFLSLLKNPFMVGFSIVILAFTLYHSLTWFFLIGRVMPIKVGRKATTPFAALAINTVILGAISYVVIWLFLS